ncbi:MAG: Lsr2 family protein [Bifidobacteriaceae bacterium]|jgi:hypothetical protein|nr:Lsr2 family protein [Bifidobacteriaceae bacterium]
MAQRVVVQLIDDLDQGPATSTVSFGLDGREYTIDLNDKHAAELREALAPYVKVARKAGKRTGSAAARSVVSDFDPAAVRAWASSNGIKVSTRGRIPATVVEKYHAAGY